MRYIAENKETAQEWVCTESLLSIDGSKTVAIPHQTRYNITSAGFTVSMIVQPGTSFRIGKKTVGGWEITHASGTITFTAYNTTTSLSVSAPVLAGKKSRVTAYYTAAGKIGLYINNTPESKTESAGTITGDLTNASGIVISGTSLSGFLAIYDKAISEHEFERINNEAGVVPKVLHANCVGFWPMQERTGAKSYDTVEQFNYAKGTSLTPNHGDLTGYTATELGTATNETTQTAKVDFYTKAVIDRTNGSGVDLKSGLPELVNCVTAPTTTTIEFPTTLTSVNPNEWSIYWSFYVDSDSLTANSYNDYVLVFGGGSAVSRRGRVLVGLSEPGHYLEAFPATIDTEIVWKKGFHTVCIQKLATRHIQILIDGRLAATKEAQTGKINQPYWNINSDLTLASISTHKFDNAIYSWRVINYGIANYAISPGEFAALHNNTFFKNPTSLNRWLCYYQFNSSASSYTDLTGKSSTATSSITLTSSTINSLR
jgi:hypothetical protein